MDQSYSEKYLASAELTADSNKLFRYFHKLTTRTAWQNFRRS